MDKSKIIIIWILLAEVLLAIASSFLFLHFNEDDAGREYRVEIERISKLLENEEDTARIMEIISDKENYPHIVSVTLFDPSERSNYDYAVLKGADGNLYSVSYVADAVKNKNVTLIILIWGIVIVFTVILWIYISKKILKPFRDMAELPAELSRGNLSIPLKEEKNRYFGRFLWGMDMLRESLEQQKADRLRMEQEKKTLVLSISHDIKTPISAINLYNKALAEGIYDTEDKKQAAHQGIERNLKELEKYVDEIREASRDDFLSMKVKDGEWYLSEMIDKIRGLYEEKTANLHISFTIDPFQNCLLKGDCDRGVEVLQNIMENALKYGDGREIKMSFSDEEDCRLICVENTGCRLPENELNNIFDSFYRGTNSTNQQGSGLGLYICRQIMQAMDGDIFAEINGDRFSVTAVFRKR